MKKIMFNDRYGLTEAVLEKRKPMTRRNIKWDMLCDMREDSIDFVVSEKVLLDGRLVFTAYNVAGDPIGQAVSAYHIGEEVAVAQKYKDAISPLDWANRLIYEEERGWTNKMFVRADLMPHQIRITGIRVERLQDITDEDCLREGLFEVFPYIDRNPNDKVKSYRFIDKKSKYGYYQLSPVRDCFAVFIDRASGKGTWERNPWVFVYEFELMK